MTSYNGLSKDTKPPNKDVVTPCVVVETQLTHPKQLSLLDLILLNMLNLMKMEDHLYKL